jgi:hypothetical protein
MMSGTHEERNFAPCFGLYSIPPESEHDQTAHYSTLSTEKLNSMCTVEVLPEEPNKRVQLSLTLVPPALAS